MSKPVLVQSLARGLDVIRAFDADHVEMTLSQVAERTGLSRATARRFLHTLVDLGYVRSRGKLFGLTPQVLQLGYSYLAGMSLAQLAQPILDDLSRELDDSTSVSVLDGGSVVYIARTQTKRIMRVGITVGTRFPAFATSMGRVLLATLDEDQLREALHRVPVQRLTQQTISHEKQLREELEKVRRQGWCLVDQELEEGLSSLAVPIRTPDGRVDGALNVSMRAWTLREMGAEQAVAERLPALQSAAETIAMGLTAQR